MDKKINRRSLLKNAVAASIAIVGAFCWTMVHQNALSLC